MHDSKIKKPITSKTMIYNFFKYLLLKTVNNVNIFIILGILLFLFLHKKFLTLNK